MQPDRAQKQARHDADLIISSSTSSMVKGSKLTISGCFASALQVCCTKLRSTEQTLQRSCVMMTSGCSSYIKISTIRDVSREIKFNICRIPDGIVAFFDGIFLILVSHNTSMLQCWGTIIYMSCIQLPIL